MNARAKIALIVASVAIAIPQSAFAGEPNAKLWNGTWTLNSGKSQFKSSVREATETRSYQVSDTRVEMKSSSKDVSGKPMNFSYSAGYDGKWYPMVGNPNGDSISLTSVSDRELKGSSMLNGKPAVEFVATVSADGKHLTVKRKMLRMEGAPEDVLEFDR